LREKKSDPNRETNVIGKQIDNGLFEGYFGRNTQYICLCKLSLEKKNRKNNDMLWKVTAKTPILSCELIIS